MLEISSRPREDALDFTVHVSLNVKRGSLVFVTAKHLSEGCMDTSRVAKL